MTHTYNIKGITCNGCVAKIKSELLKLGDITQADVQLTSPQATIKMQKHVPVEVLQSALQKAGHYTITEADSGMHHEAADEDEQKTKSWFNTYKPILLIFFYISVVSVIAGTSANGFSWMTGMRFFMSGFFLAF
jgi:copper chaperone CopZ